MPRRLGPNDTLPRVVHLFRVALAALDAVKVSRYLEPITPLDVETAAVQVRKMLARAEERWRVTVMRKHAPP